MKNYIKIKLLLASLFIFAFCEYTNAQIQSDYFDVTAVTGNGLRFWNGNDNFKIHMGSTSAYRYGPVTNFSIKMNMNNNTTRGWTWGVLNTAPIAALNTQGNYQVAGWMRSMNRNYYFGTVQRLNGDNGSTLNWYSNNSNVTQFALRDKEGLRYGRLYGSGNGANFGLLDGDGNWSYLAAKDNYTAFRINNSEKMRIEDDGRVGIGTATPHPSALLEIQSSNRGLLPPRVTNTTVITSPAEGLIIYDNSDNAFKYYDGSTWKNMVKHVSFPDQSNSFLGVSAGASNTIGTDNTAVGNFALFNNTEGNFNTAFGSGALFSNTTGDDNIAVGWRALGLNTDGGQNVAIGSDALALNADGHSNVAVGWRSLVLNESGDENIAIGYRALQYNSVGNSNVAIGHRAFSDVNATAFSNSTAVGYNAEPGASNRVRLGNSSITQIGGYASWSNVSDARFKKQVKDDVPGLEFISLLNPVTYKMDMDAIAKFHGTPDESRLKDSEQAKAAIRYTGFLAQEVEKAAQTVNYDFSGVDVPQHKRDNYSLRYAEFVVPLVKAVQELDEKNEKLEEENNEKDEKITDLEARLTRLEQALLNGQSETINTIGATIEGRVRLDQNVPNPFNGQTTIKYYVPENTSSAYLQINDIQGRELKMVTIDTVGEGQLELSTEQLPTGNYTYSLVIDGQLIDTKKMVLSK